MLSRVSVRNTLAQAWEDARPLYLDGRRGLIEGARRAWPYAVFIGLAIGGVLVVGVNLSNAFPSEQRPFGWPGTSSLPNGVAMVRDELVIATVLPALALGFVSLRGLSPKADRVAYLGGIAMAGFLALATGIAVGTAWGAEASSKSTWAQGSALWWAHVLLAWATFAVTLFACAAGRRYGAALAGATFAFYVAVYDNLLQWRVFREAGYHRLSAGDFPEWFLAAQVGSPISAYRGNLILGKPEFMDGLERAVLKDAALPSWANSNTFAAALLAIWIVLPLGLAAAAWNVHAWLSTRPLTTTPAAPVEQPRERPL